ncbi:MAG: biotin--[acetyl-CoA-carboxylase] ligase [Candidatus Omnitrophica bacterium 4484_213]|nr:MAG: biotin--[acetyl-CoA-carboxylase] ligase [Candidatus Omnitrophica bacterium 4484_213]
MKFLFFNRVSSTQDVAYRLALQGEQEGTVVVSDYQTAGRGKLGRKWFAPPEKNILCSVILRPNISPGQVFLLTRSAAYAIKKVIEKKTDLSLCFKHPNDLLINGKKVAGVLAETHLKGEKLEFVILGMGINVNAVRGNYEGMSGRPVATSQGINAGKEQLIEGATSLKQETGKSFSRPALLREILRNLKVR